MKDVIKKISMALLIVSLGWFPIQATFATAFIMPAGNMNMSAQAVSAANSELALAAQDTQQIKKSISNCDTHPQVKDCCSKSSSCNASDQECGHCLSFLALAHEQQQTSFIPLYTTHYTNSHNLSGMVAITAYRPPR